MGRFTFTREFYIPAGAVKVSAKNSTAVVYAYTNANAQPCAVGFVGKADKPSFRHRFQSETQRTRFVSEFFAGQASRAAYKAKVAAERKAYVNDYKPGDVLYTCWGYDQTNVEYFEVTATKGKTVELREISRKYIENGFRSGYSIPLPGEYVGAAFTRRAQEGAIKIDDCRRAYRLGFETVAEIKVYKTTGESHYA